MEGRDQYTSKSLSKLIFYPTVFFPQKNFLNKELTYLQYTRLSTGGVHK